MLSNKSIYDLFKEEVGKSSTRIAISYNHKQISYTELDKMSDRVYGLIQSGMAHKDKPIAVDFKTPPEAIPGVLGIIKSCAAYLTSDLEYSPGNYQQIIENFGIRYVLTGMEKGSATEPAIVPAIVPEESLTGRESESSGAAIANGFDDPFLIDCRTGYKRNIEGRVLSYKSIANWLSFNIDTLKVNFKNTLFIAAPVMELGFPLWLAPLLTGGTVNFLRIKDITNPPDLKKKAYDCNASTIILPLNYLRTLIHDKEYEDLFPGSVENIISTGEEVFYTGKFKAHTREKGARWHNYFGFPEIHMISTIAQENTESHRGGKHIGKPISNTNMYVLNNMKQPVSIGIPGELYASGNGATDSFYMNEHLRSEFFITNSFGTHSKLYKSGFRAKWLSDGKLELDGRFDEWRRINGHRICLKDVEAALLEHPLIEDCAADVRLTDRSEAGLLVYFVSREQTPGRQLEEYLKAAFPMRLFPIGFVRLVSLPRTLKGNVDKEYLSRLNFQDTATLDLMETMFRKEYGIEYIRIMTEEATETPGSIDISHFVPGFSKDQGKKTEPPPGRTSEELEDTGPMAVIYGRDLITENEPGTLIEALENAASRNGNNGIVYIGSEGTEQFQTYKQLLEESERMIAGLRKLGVKPRDKIIMSLDKNEDFIPVFWACILGGIVPVPISLPKMFESRSNATNILHNVWEIIDKPLILTTGKLEESILSLSNLYDFEGLQTAGVEDLRRHNPDNTRHKSSPQDLALLLFTSGSTGIPKGVKQSHKSILAREIGTTQLNGFNDRDISINWMPLEHVGGIVMFHIKEVYLGCTQIQVKTEYILANPLQWLNLITKHRATLTWAPNFAFALINDRIEQVHDANWDFSSMRFILNGGEAINAATAKKFLRNLEAFGLRKDAMHPSWGMSETCSGVVYSELLTSEPDAGIHILDKHSPGGVVRKVTDDRNGTVFVELGKPIPGVAIRIADSNNKPVREGKIGRIQIEGPSVTAGYYNNPGLNKEVFTEDGWFSTGDLGFIYNGRMTISGREKDVIIINGVNYNNNEIEAVVEEVEGVETSFTAACAVRDGESDTDKLVIFYCSLYGDIKKKIGQTKEIRKKILEKAGVSPDYIIPVDREEIPKTAIGKIQRLKLGKLFEEGSFNNILEKVHIDIAGSQMVPSWFFKKGWYACEPFLTNEKSSTGNCLVFEGEPGQCEELVETLQNMKSICIRVRHGNSFEKNEGRIFRINYYNPRDYKYLFDTLKKEGTPIENILHFGCFSEHDSDPFERDAILRHQKMGINSLLYIIRELNTGFGHPVKLFVISNYTQLTNQQDKTDFGKFTLPGFVKSVSLECSWLHCCHIDLDNNLMESNIPCITAELKNLRRDGEVAYRKGKRLIPLLSELNMDSGTIKDIPLIKNGIYLVTGGLGGIGLHVSRVLMEKFGARLLIVGKTQLPDRKQWGLYDKDEGILSRRIQAYKELESSGGEFLYAAGDLTDRSFLKEVIERGRSKWCSPLSGVFHLAGMGNLEYHWKVMDRHWVTEENTETFEEMFKTKVSGTLNLHSLLEGNSEAIFVAFSSISTFFGAATFSAYAAANSFLDSFCLYRKYNGYPGTFSLNWSTWDNVGMSANNPANMTRAMISSGYKIIPVKQGINSMLLSLCINESSQYIGLDRDNINIGRVLKRHTGGKQVIKFFYSLKENPTFDEELFRKNVSGIVLNDYAADGILEFYKLEPGRQTVFAHTGVEPTTVNLNRPQTGGEKRLLAIWKDLLHKADIGVNDNFFELGGQSLKAATLIANIHKEFSVRVPIGEVFKKPTIKELAKHIKSIKRTKFSSIKPVGDKEHYKLSPAQKRLFILYRIDGANISYNIPAVLIVEGKLDRERLESSLNELIKRHASFRTSFDIVGGEPMQHVEENVYLEIIHGKIGEEKIEAVIERFIRPFDLSKAPLLRVELIFMEDDKHLLLFDMHHIISDGTSLAVLIREFVDLYEGRKLPPLLVQYKDFSEWQNRALASETMKKHEEYWINSFAGEIPVLNIRTDYPGSRVRQIEGDRIEFEIENDLVYNLNKLSLETGTTLFMILMAAYYVLLSKYSGQEDIVVGVPIAGRSHPDLENIIGMFVNTLAMRNFADGGRTFIEFLESVKLNSLQAFENQDYQFEELVEKLNLKRDLSRKPLFDTMFSVINMEIPEIRIKNLKFTPYKIKHQASKYDITLNAAITDFDIKFYLQYASKLFHRETMERLAAHYTTILYDITDNPYRKLFEIEMMSEAEKYNVIYEFNNTISQYPKDRTIHRLFEEQVERTPDKTALVSGEHSLSYRDLNEKANRLAGMLRDEGVKPGCIVGVITELFLEMIISILGVLKAGGAYLPINVKLPKEQIDFVLKDSGAGILLTDHYHAGKISFDGRVILFNDVIMCGMDSNNLSVTTNPGDLAYVIYTSGTTGVPKGVLVEHKGLVNYSIWFSKKAGLTPGDETVLLSSLCFDLSYTALYPALISGCTLHLLQESIYLDLPVLVDYLGRNKITFIKSTPSFFNLFVNCHTFSGNNNLRDIRLIVLGGEKIRPYDVEQFHIRYPETVIMNHYGPTETTIGAVAQAIDFNNFGQYKIHPVIGKPIDNTKIYILDKNLMPMPVGIAGEIHIAGDGVARGYLNRPDLGSEKFIPDPFSEGTGEYLYKTGDLGRFLGDGSIEFLERMDQQVKIHGYRVELEEIRKQLIAHPQVRESAVLLRKRERQNQAIYAYIVSGTELDASRLRKFLSKKLPEYMIPSYYIQLEKLPLTLNGKLDMKVLEECENYLGAGSEYIAPGNEIEKSLSAIWSSVLGTERIGIRDNFFDIGGTSLAIIQTHARIDEIYPGKVKITDLFSYLSIERLAEYIENGAGTYKEGILPVKCICLPEEYFSEKFEGNMNSVYKLEFKEDIYGILKKGASLEGVKTVDILLSVLVYLLARVTEQKSVEVQLMVGNDDRVISLRIDPEGLGGFPDLFKAVKQKQEERGMSYKLSDAYKQGILKEHTGVIPFFFRKGHLTVKENLTDIYDIVLEIEEERTVMSLRFEFAVNRFKEEKMEFLVDTYTSLVELIAEQYKGIMNENPV